MDRVDRVAIAPAVIAGATAYIATKIWVTMKATTAGAHWAQRSTKGIKGVLLQNMPDVFYEKPAGMAELAWAIEARAAGKTLVASSMSIGSISYLPIEPADVEYMMMVNGNNYPKPPMYENLKLIMGGAGLVTERDETAHGAKRRMLNPAFRPAALRSISGSVFVPHVQRLLEKLSESVAAAVRANAKTLDVEQHFNDASLDIIAEAAFHCENDEQKKDVRENFNQQNVVLTASPYVLVPLFEPLPTPPRSALLRILAQQRGVALSIINAAKHALSQPTSPLGGSKELLASTETHSNATSLMDILVGMEGLTPVEIADHAMTFLFAGQDTTSGTMTWAAYALARYPAVQRALLEEVSSVIGLGQVPTVDSVQDLPYLENVVKEVLRVFPAVSGVGRVAQEDDLLPSGAVIPKGAEVWISIINLHMHPGIYGPDVQEFRPERWEDPSLAARVGQVGWMPFSLGKRNCIGKDFAMQEMKMILAVVVRNFELGLPTATAEPWRQQLITSRPKERIPFTVKPRSAS